LQKRLLQLLQSLWYSGFLVRGSSGLTPSYTLLRIAKLGGIQETKMHENNVYTAPDIIYEGELEVQAGSPVGLPVWDELEEW
jgi:hypothetical protein